jgi:hypothetical protein
MAGQVGQVRRSLQAIGIERHDFLKPTGAEPWVHNAQLVIPFGSFEPELAQRRTLASLAICR